jgi:hypothetical protein
MMMSQHRSVAKRVATVVVVFACVGLFAGSPVASEELTCSLVGRVTSLIGEAVAGAEVRLEPIGARSVSDAEGGFNLKGIAPGSYRLTVSAEGYQWSERVVVLTPNEVAEITVELRPALTALGEVTVSSSYGVNISSPHGGVALSRDQLLETPHFGDDVVRALPLLPGVAGNDTTATFNVRGGLDRDVLYTVDGLEIYEPFHLKDYQGIFTIISPRLIAEGQLLPGGFAAEYGDRMSGVLDLSTVTPIGKTSWDLGISLTTAWASGAGAFSENRGSWFASARRGYLDLIMDWVGPEDEEEETREGDGPAYWDIHAKVAYQLKPGHTLSLMTLLSDDGIEVEEREIEDGRTEYEFWNTSYGNSYLWFRDDWVVGESTFVATVGSVGRVDRDRITRGEEPASTSLIDDRRKLDLFGLRQDWSHQAGLRHYLKWGFDLRSYDADYDYYSEGEFGGGGPTITEFEDSFSSTNYSVYAADRFRLGDALTAEVGLRWDRQSLTDDDQLSPRINIVWAITDDTVLRGGWGLYHQSQRPHELQVQDGETEFHRAERSEHLTVGIEHSHRSGNAIWHGQVNGFLRSMDELRPRWENLFDPLPQFPETRFDRYLVDATSAEAYGFELYLARRGQGRFDWWVAYTWSKATDEIAGEEVYRQFDQRHAFNLTATWRPTKRWTIGAAWIFHTGWPTTDVTAELVEYPDGSFDIIPEIGPINAERLPSYHRLDLRVSRNWTLKRRGIIELFIDIQNAYDRQNVSGYDINERSFQVDDEGNAIFVPKEEKWLGIVPSFGVRWSF